MTATLRWFSDGPAIDYADDSLGIRERIYLLGYPKAEAMVQLRELERHHSGLQRTELNSLFARESRTDKLVPPHLLLGHLFKLLAKAHGILPRSWKARA